VAPESKWFTGLVLSAAVVVGGVLEWHWMGFSGYWSENSAVDWCWSAAGVIGGVLELHYSGYWSENGSLDWCWSAVGAIGGVLEWNWMGHHGHWSKISSLD
jgi:hypothetical protein